MDQADGGVDHGENEADAGKSMWGKKWNKRTVVGQLYKDRVQHEQERLIGEGLTPFAAYQPALTKVFEGLSEADRKSCAEQADKWNTGSWPRELQIVYVQLLSQTYLHTNVQ